MSVVRWSGRGVGCCPADFGLPLLLAPRRGASSSDRSAAEGSIRRLATRCLASRPHSLHARSTGPLVVGRERPLVLSACLFRLGDYLSGIRSRIAEPHRAVARDEIAGEGYAGTPPLTKTPPFTVATLTNCCRSSRVWVSGRVLSPNVNIPSSSSRRATSANDPGSSDPTLSG